MSSESSDTHHIPGADNDGAARVAVGFRRTENLGDYRSLSVEVHVTLPCRVEQVETTIESAKDIANEYLAKYVVDAVKASVTTEGNTGGVRRRNQGKRYVPKSKRVRVDKAETREEEDDFEW